MAASTHWLLTAVNMYIYILVRMLPAALLPLSSFLRQVLQCLCLPALHHRRWKDSFFALSWFLPKAWVSKQGCWRHSCDGPRRDVPLQWRRLCSCRRQQGFLHHLYTRWQHIMLLFFWARCKETNAYNMQQSVEFSQCRKEEFRKLALDVESSVHCLCPNTPGSFIMSKRDLLF